MPFGTRQLWRGDVINILKKSHMLSPGRHSSPGSKVSELVKTKLSCIAKSWDVDLPLGEQRRAGGGETNPRCSWGRCTCSESLRTDAKEAGHSLCLGHLLTTDVILSWKDFFNYSMHFRPLYSQLRQNSCSNAAWSMDVWHCVAIASLIFAKGLLIYYLGIMHLPCLLLPIGYYEEQCNWAWKSFNPVYKHSPPWIAHTKYLQDH